MAPNSPACSFIHASMAGSRSTAPSNRSNSVLIISLLSAFESCGYVTQGLYRKRANTPCSCMRLALRASDTTLRLHRTNPAVEAGWSAFLQGDKCSSQSECEIILEHLGLIGFDTP